MGRGQQRAEGPQVHRAGDGSELHCSESKQSKNIRPGVVDELREMCWGCSPRFAEEVDLFYIESSLRSF